MNTMKTSKEDMTRKRKEYARKGTRSQIMTTFRLDKDLADWLAAQVNKGRYINELIRTDREKNLGDSREPHPI